MLSACWPASLLLLLLLFDVIHVQVQQTSIELKFIWQVKQKQNTKKKRRLSKLKSKKKIMHQVVVMVVQWFDLVSYLCVFLVFFFFISILCASTVAFGCQIFESISRSKMDVTWHRIQSAKHQCEEQRWRRQTTLSRVHNLLNRISFKRLNSFENSLS